MNNVNSLESGKKVLFTFGLVLPSDRPKKKVTKSPSEPTASTSLVAKFDSLPKSITPRVCVLRPDPKTFYQYYNGKIVPTFKGVQYCYIRDVAKNILFSQESISDFFTQNNCDIDINDLATRMFVRFDKSCAIDIVRRDGNYITLDNRRLTIACRFNCLDRYYGIYFIAHSAEDLLPEYMKFRFPGAITWKDALDQRLGDNREGYTKEPSIANDKKLAIFIDKDEMDLSQLHEEDSDSLLEKAKSHIMGKVLI